MKDKEVLPIMNPLLGMHLISAEEMLGIRYDKSVKKSEQLNSIENMKLVRAKLDMVDKVCSMGVRVRSKDLKLFGL